MVHYFEGGPSYEFMPLYDAVAQHAITAGITNILSVRSEKELRAAKWEDEGEEGSLTMAQANRDLLFGQFRCADCGHEYGYALERLCQLLGTRMEGHEFADLRDLRIDSPLCNWRVPVELPKIEDFPYIGYLTADEVQAEVARLEAMDLSDPRSQELGTERNQLLQCLQRVRQEGLAVVAFYY